VGNGVLNRSHHGAAQQQAAHAGNQQRQRRQPDAQPAKAVKFGAAFGVAARGAVGQRLNQRLAIAAHIGVERVDAGQQGERGRVVLAVFQLLARHIHPLLRKALARLGKARQQGLLLGRQRQLAQLRQQGVDFFTVFQRGLHMHVQRMVVQADHWAAGVVLQAEHDLRAVVGQQEHHPVDDIRGLQVVLVHGMQRFIAVVEGLHAKKAQERAQHAQRGHRRPEPRAQRHAAPATGRQPALHACGAVARFGLSARLRIWRGAHRHIANDLAVFFQRGDQRLHPIEIAVFTAIFHQPPPGQPRLHRAPQILESRHRHIRVAHDIVAFAQ